MTADSLRLTAITQDVGNAVEELDAVLVGTELTVGDTRDTNAGELARSLTTSS